MIGWVWNLIIIPELLCLWEHTENIPAEVCCNKNCWKTSGYSECLLQPDFQWQHNRARAHTCTCACTHTHAQSIGYFYEYLIVTSHNACFYTGITSCCPRLELTVNCVGKFELSTAMRTTLWLLEQWKFLRGTWQTGYRDFIELGTTSVHNWTNMTTVWMHQPQLHLCVYYHWWLAYHLPVPKHRNEISYYVTAHYHIWHMKTVLQYCNANTLSVQHTQHCYVLSWEIRTLKVWVGKREIKYPSTHLPSNDMTTCIHSFYAVPTSTFTEVSGFPIFLSLPWQHHFQTEEWVFMPSAPCEGLGLMYVIVSHLRD
jgi:hypothetical protein